MRTLVWCAMALLPLAAQAADPFPDDHGDAPAESTLVSPGGAPSNGTIEIDTDQDWFRFVALPGISYRIDVTSASIWDTVLELRGPDRSTVWACTNSSRSPTPATSTISRTNTGAAATYYVGISGYLKFTTGTYSIAVQPLNWADSDKDGLPDAWETEHLHTLAWGAGDDPDGDGASNLDEYYAMTDPGNSNSVLRITSISTMPGGVSLQWSGAPFSAYRVRAANGLPATEWPAVGTNYNMSDHEQPEQRDDLSAGTARVYRVELIFGD